MQEQSSLLREQDAELEQLGKGVQRVKALAGVMKEELGEQAVILDQLEDDVVKTDSNMQTLQKKLRGLVDGAKSSDRALWSIICCLVVVLVVVSVVVPPVVSKDAEGVAGEDWGGVSVSGAQPHSTVARMVLTPGHAGEAMTGRALEPRLDGTGRMGSPTP